MDSSVAAARRDDDGMRQPAAAVASVCLHHSVVFAGAVSLLIELPECIRMLPTLPHSLREIWKTLQLIVFRYCPVHPSTPLHV